METTNSSPRVPVHLFGLTAILRMNLIPLACILGLAIILRLIMLIVFPRMPTGGDTSWYLQYGLDLVTNRPPGISATGPTFLVYVGLLQLVIPAGSVIVAARLLNICWHVMLIAGIYILGMRYFD